MIEDKSEAGPPTGEDESQAFHLFDTDAIQDFVPIQNDKEDQIR